MKNTPRCIQVIALLVFISNANIAKAQQDSALMQLPHDIIDAWSQHLTSQAYNGLVRTHKMDPIWQDKLLRGLLSTTNINFDLKKVSPLRVTELLGIFNTKDLPLKLVFSFISSVQLTTIIPYCSKVVSLKFLGSLGAAGAYVIANSGYMTTLKNLDLSVDCDMGDLGASHISTSSTLISLESLSMRRTLLGNQGFNNLIRTTTLTNLTHLDVSGNHIDDIGLSCLMPIWWLTSLRSLDMSYNKIRDIGAGTFAISPNMTSLWALSLTHNNIHDAGVSALGVAKILSSLKSLKLRGNQISSKVIQGIEDSRYLTNLTYLDVSVKKRFR